MTRNHLKDGIRQGFSDMTPDIFDAIMMQIEQEEPQEGPQEKSAVYTTVMEEPVRRRFFSGHMGRMVAACVMCLMIGVGVVQMHTPVVLPAGGEVYVVYMEINPSVRMIFDERYRLLELEGMNADGKALEKRLHPDASMTLDEVMDWIVEDGQSQGYLNGKNDIHFTFVDDAQTNYDEWKEEFEDTVEKHVSEKRDVEIEVTYEEQSEDVVPEKETDRKTTKKAEVQSGNKAETAAEVKEEEPETEMEKEPEEAGEKIENKPETDEEHQGKKNDKASEKAVSKNGSKPENAGENQGKKAEHASEKAIENEEKQADKKEQKESEKAEKKQEKNNP